MADKFTVPQPSTRVPVAVLPAGVPASSYPLNLVSASDNTMSFTQLSNGGYLPSYSTQPVPAGNGRA